MSSNDRARQWQEKQRPEKQSAKQDGWDSIKEMYKSLKAAKPASTVYGTGKPAATPSTAIKHTWQKIYGTTATTSNSTIPITGTYGSGGTFTVPNSTWYSVGVGTGSYPQSHPSDDVTRQMVERAVLAAIDRCLAADHYPKGIALTQTAYDALKDSPLVGVKHDYWSDGIQPLRFLDLPLHIVEMMDPLDVEVGW